MFDVLIIGGGVAGVSCALILGSAQKKPFAFDKKIDSNEHRIYQQFITKQKLGRVLVQHRYRIEERFLKDDFQMRFRYFLGINIPINKKTMEKNTVYLSTYNEVFINAVSPLFDRNRLYGAIGYMIHKNIRFV